MSTYFTVAIDRLLFQNFRCMEDPLELNFLSDWQERMTALIEYGNRVAFLAEEEKSSGDKVDGCSTEIWIRLEWDPSTGARHKVYCNGRLVRGLVGALARTCDGGSLERILHLDTSLLHELGLWNRLTPTRQEGLYQVCLHVRRQAHSLLAKAGSV